MLRLVVQKLMVDLGEQGTDINKDIGKLVEKGLHETIQRALDICRVVGNEAVHPGQLDLNATPEMVFSLFETINFIVEDRISRPKQLEEMYQRLPAQKLQGIENRDKKTKPQTPERNTT